MIVGAVICVEIWNPENGRKIVELPSLTVGEAVMRMEQAEASCLVFRNSANGWLNVVHRRDDGHIGWVEAASGESA